MHIEQGRANPANWVPQYNQARRPGSSRVDRGIGDLPTLGYPPAALALGYTTHEGSLRSHDGRPSNGAEP